MTDLLTTAFEEASHLPAEERDRLAEWILAELRDEHDWDSRFTRSQSTLAKMAREALAQRHRGKTRPFPDTGDR